MSAKQSRHRKLPKDTASRNPAQVTPARITFEEMQQAILASGYPLEQRVLKKLRDAKLHVHTNFGYPDPETGISRECDLLASTFYIEPPGSQNSLGVVFVAECENNQNPISFFLTGERPKFLHADVVKCSGTPTEILSRHEWTPIAEALRFKSFHHYAKQRVATQYCSFAKPKDRDKSWVALHPDQHHQTLDNLTNALESVISRGSPFVPSPPLNAPRVDLTFYYPVLILQGELYIATSHRKAVKLESVEHVQYQRHVCTSDRDRTYQIDVIREDFLPSYLQLVFDEVETILDRLASSLRAIEKSLKESSKAVNTRMLQETPRRTERPTTND